jgi:hypothetical protein
MTDDLEPDDSPGVEFAALVVVACIVGAALVMAASALWRLFA